MSFNASWMGIRAGAKAEVLRRLDLFETGEIDFGTSRGLFCAEWPSGWLVFYGPIDLVTPDLLSRASINGEAVFCIASDVSMYSEALGYRAGASEWTISHNCQRGDRDLEVSGSPPPVPASICCLAFRTSGSMKAKSCPCGVSAFAIAANLLASSVQCRFLLANQPSIPSKSVRVSEASGTPAAGQNKNLWRRVSSLFVLDAAGELAEADR